MLSGSVGGRNPHSLLAALVATSVVVTAAFGWFGWRLVDQQRALDERRAHEWTEAGAEAMSASVRGKLADAGAALGAAFQWHNYGKSPIGERSDIENVPIERLQAFYRTYYQPDNAVLIKAGDFAKVKS